MAAAGAKVFDGTLATGNNVDTAEFNLGGSEFCALFITSDKALTGKFYVSPLSKAMDAVAPTSNDYYKLGSDIAIAASTPLATIITVGGAATGKLNLANAAGTTATIKVWARPSVSLIGR